MDTSKGKNISVSCILMSHHTWMGREHGGVVGWAGPLTCLRIVEKEKKEDHVVSYQNKSNFLFFLLFFCD